MIKTDKPTLFAAIDIGSSQLTMKIIQINSSKKIQLLENVTKTLPLGRDTFSTGRISAEMLDALCQVLSGFRQLMREYHIRRYKAVATSAFREAKNREYILEQVKVRTKLNIQILEVSEERYYMQIAARKSINRFDKLRKEGLLIINIGSGTIHLNGYGKSGLEYNRSFHLGPLRIKELLASVEQTSLQFPKVLDEYVMTHISNEKFPYQHVAITGRVVEMLTRYNILTEKMTREEFDQLYNKLIYMPSTTLARTYHIDGENAELLIPTMIVLRSFWARLDVAKVMCPQCSMTDGLLHEMTSLFLNENDQTFTDEIINGAYVMAKTYGIDEKHTMDVMEKALLLFDKLDVPHGLTQRHRMMLQIAVSFHDTGRSINFAERDFYSALLVSSSEMIGLSREEQQMIELIVRYHNDEELNYQDPNYLALSHISRMAVSKLLAILQVAYAMDASYKQKFSNVRLKIDDGKLKIYMVPQETYLLEKWSLERHAAFFQDVFGLEPQLKVERGK